MMVSSASPRVADGGGEVALLVGERGVEQQAAHADHRVHRRADLVAHRGQERALRLVGRLRRGARVLRLLEQAGVLDGDHALVGEGLQQVDVLLRVRMGGLPGDRYAADARGPARSSARPGARRCQTSAQIASRHRGYPRRHWLRGSKEAGAIESQPEHRTLDRPRVSAQEHFGARSDAAVTAPTTTCCRSSTTSTALPSLGISRVQLSRIFSNTGLASATESLITCNTSAVAVCRSSASFVSLNSRAFWIAITAWSREVWQQRRLPCRRTPGLGAVDRDRTDDLLVAHHRHRSGRFGSPPLRRPA